MFLLFMTMPIIFDELAQRLKQCCIRTARFEAFFHIENLTQKDLVRLFKLCEQINLKILGFDEMPQPSIGIHEICVMHANTSLQSRLSYSVILKNRYLFAQANLYVLGHVQGVLDFYMPIVYYMLLLYV